MRFSVFGLYGGLDVVVLFHFSLPFDQSEDAQTLFFSFNTLHFERWQLFCLTILDSEDGGLGLWALLWLVGKLKGVVSLM